jgi:hypothetical protein
VSTAALPAAAATFDAAGRSLLDAECGDEIRAGRVTPSVRSGHGLGPVAARDRDWCRTVGSTTAQRGRWPPSLVSGSPTATSARTRCVANALAAKWGLKSKGDRQPVRPFRALQVLGQIQLRDPCRDEGESPGWQAERWTCRWIDEFRSVIAKGGVWRALEKIETRPQQLSQNL